MARRALLALTTLVVVVSVGSGCHRHDPPPLALDVGEGGPVLFPPSSEGWTERTALPAGERAHLEHPERVNLASPSLDAKNHFTFDGSTLRLVFDDVLIDEAQKASAPVLGIEPAVAGATVWTGPREVEFRAQKPFTVDATYTLTVPPLVGPSGRKFEGLRATFEAKPSIEIAGKTIHYLPSPGHAKVVMLNPRGAEIGSGQEIGIVYDQPVDLGVAATLVKATADEAALPLSLRHPDKDVFQGQKVDRRFVVLARPTKVPAFGAKFKLEAASQAPLEADAHPESEEYSIATPPTVESIGCSSAAECEVTGTKVLASSTAQFVARFTTPLGLSWDEAKKFVRVVPQPKNLYVSAYGKDVHVSGSFAPSTSYRVTVQGIRDVYGYPVPAVAATFETRSLPASIAMPEGATVLDEASLRSFAVTTRNADAAELRLWALPKDDVAAMKRALEGLRSRTTPEGDPSVVIPLAPSGKRDVYSDAVLDLSKRLDRDRTYVAQARVTRVAGNAPQPTLSGDRGSQTPTGILVAAGPSALAAHVHHSGEKAVVQVFRLGSGEPVADVVVAVGDRPARATTDGLGAAVLTVGRALGDADVLTLEEKGTRSFIPLGGTTKGPDARALYADLAQQGDDERATEAVGMIVTDRGVYRPGTKLSLKGFARKVETGAVTPLPNTSVRLKIVDPRDTEVVNEVVKTNERGSFTKDVPIASGWHTGRYTLRLERDSDDHALLASETVRVAEFETPKFKVDVEPAADGPTDKLQARVIGRYLFGAPMSGAKVAWVLRKHRVPVRGGALAEAGLSFDREWGWYDDGPSETALKAVTGEAALAADGTLPLDVATGPLADGPTELELEADVTDASHRHVAGHARVVRDPVDRHAGLRVERRFGGTGTPLRVSLGVVDRAGNAVIGAKVTARMERLTWTRAAEKAESGATVERWKETAKLVTECDVTSAATPTSCDLAVDKGGDYRITARVDDREGARTSYWAWGGIGEERGPSQGKKVALVTDRTKYKAGETAKLLVQSPYPHGALALLTLEQGGLVHHESKKVSGPSTTFDVPITRAHAPWVNAAVTLLPLGTSEADYRVGAVRIPVAADDARFDVTVSSGKKVYEVKDEAEVTIVVKRGTEPIKNADVTLAVVDEGVLRMTNFHPKDPSRELHPGRPLQFSVHDSRGWMITRRERAHVAGGGGGEGEDSLDTRKDFVETAAWLPNLVTDASGRVTAKFRLPDNLTEFRMMAVVVDEAGSGGTAEGSFLVSKSILIEPVMPRFALRGDRFEAAAMVHNNGDAPAAAKVRIADETRELTLAAKSRARVAVPMTADKIGSRKVTYSVEVGGSVRDRVEMPLAIDEPGVEEHPRVSGAFTAKQEVVFQIPGDAVFGPDAYVSLKTGSALYPELGQRLSYLLDYPHGCVEQTTSSTIPLIAARTLLPWTGTTTMDTADIDKRIRAGVERLATMLTSDGGLAYWPGGSEPNVYGTAYALRALLGAKAAGIEHPKLVEKVTKFLGDRLDGERDPGLRVAMAEVLSQADALPESAADSLYDVRDKLDPFGLANLALALDRLRNQDDRVREVMDKVEAGFDPAGSPTKVHGEDDWHYWGSSDRDRAQALVALNHLRKQSKLAPVLAARLARSLDHYTTQSTAWSLLALADHVGSRKPDGGVDAKIRLEGKILDTYQRLGGDNKEVRIPLSVLAGKRVTVVLEGDPKVPSAFALEATYKRPPSAKDGRVGRRDRHGVSIHRAYSDPSGKFLDLSKVEAGQLVRVALRIDVPAMDDYRQGYLAVTDRLPAGLEALNPDLETTARVEDLKPEHPFYDGLHGGSASADHVDLRGDRVQLYFDQLYGRHVAYATYLARATTPGTFAIPTAQGELMYEPDSLGYSDAAQLTVLPKP